MIKKENVTILIWVTVLLDLALIGILATQSLNAYEVGFVWSMLVAHALFYLGLVSKNMWLLDILHYFVFIALIFSVFLSNFYLLGTSLALLVAIQIMWRVYGSCVLNEDNYVHPFCNEVEIGTLLLTGLVGLKIFFGKFYK